MKETQEKRVWSLGQENTLEKKMATHSSILAWRIPWTEELSGLQSTGSQRIRRNWAHTPSFINSYKNTSLYCTWLYFNFTRTAFLSVLFTHWGFVQPCIKQLCWHYFSNVICSLCVSVSHFGNSCNISNLFIMVIFIRVICDQWPLMLLLQKDYGWLKAQIMVSLFSSRAFLMKTYALFRHSAISYLADCTKVYTTVSHALGNWEICMLCFTVIFALMQWSGAKRARSPGLSVYP